MKFSAVIIFLLISVSIFAQSFVTNTYEVGDDLISNPERGFYLHTETSSSNYSRLNLNTLTGYREDQLITQILRVFYLGDFLNKPISEEYLENMHADLNTVRAAGIKMIVRFAYTKRSDKPYRDATPENVRNHVFQLKEILGTHTDVISVIQTGFVGAWGEWYYTDHFAGSSPWIVSDENWQDRGTLVEDLLQVLPKDRMIQLRTPGQKMRIFDTQNPITVPMAFSKENISRVGHHNDCFVASSSDFGTYTDQALEKPYLEEETKFLPMGGETCSLAPPYSDCANAYEELKRFHWSYLNISYNRNVLDAWKDQGCYDDVELNLGYRYVLNEATLATEIHPEGTFDLSLNLKNHGFANPYNPRDFEIILKSTTTDQTYRLQTDEVPGLWEIGEDFDLKIKAGLPPGIIEDTYKVYAQMPDKSQSLKENPAYAIRFFNKNNWIENEGWNDLNFELEIKSSFAQTPYVGDDFFKSTSEAEVVVPGPNSIYSGKNANTALLFWGKSTGHKYRNIERSADGTSFESIATLPAEIDFYKILDNNREYFYRFALVDESEAISYSDTIKVESIAGGTDSKIEITTDGADEDWKTILPTASLVDNQFDSYVLRTYFSLEKAHFSIYGSTDDYQIYLNTDQNTTTGSSESVLLKGMDYKLQNDSLFVFENNEWTLTSTDISTTDGSIYEIEFAHALFENIGANSLIPIVAHFNQGSVVLSESDVLPSVHTRQLPPDIPLNLEVKNSVFFPEERLEVHWEQCFYCEGYLLEKSDDGVNFSFLADLNSDKEIYNHDLLPEGTHYYRISSYNNLGTSPASATEFGILGTVNDTTQTEEPKIIEVKPNPTGGTISLNTDFESVIIYNALGAILEPDRMEEKIIDIRNFPAGVYFLLFTKNGEEQLRKVVKY